MSWLIIFWSFVMGGAVGSFLNVVVYRLPLGISIVHPPSHCPKCGKTIAWYDNVPIFGWIVLRGRCRQCRNPISSRYPVVEAITATMFAAVAAVEISQFDPHLFFVLCPYHLLLLCTLLCAGLIEFDGKRAPVTLFVPALLVGLAAPWFWPGLRPMFIQGLSASWALPVDVLGNAGILILAGIVWRLRLRQTPTELFTALICVGLFLGWPAGGVLIAAAATLHLAFLFLGRFWPKLRIPPSMLLGIVTLGWILWAARLVSS